MNSKLGTRWVSYTGLTEQGSPRCSNIMSPCRRQSCNNFFGKRGSGTWVPVWLREARPGVALRSATLCYDRKSETHVCSIPLVPIMWGDWVRGLMHEVRRFRLVVGRFVADLCPPSQESLPATVSPIRAREPDFCNGSPLA